MSTDITIKPAGAPAISIYLPPSANGAGDAVKTELPAPKAVAAVEPVAPVREKARTTPGVTSHQITIDRDAAAIVYQTIDDSTQQVVRQFPDDAILRRRAYFRSLDLQKPEPGQPIPTDRKA